MNRKERETIQKRSEAATPGEWEYTAGESESFISYFTEPGNGMVREMPFITVGVEKVEETGADEPFYYVEISEEDAEFIAHARKDIPALLDALDEAEKEIKEWSKGLDRLLFEHTSDVELYKVAIKENVTDRDYWKNRAEALERYIKSLWNDGGCQACTQNNIRPYGNPCDDCGFDMHNWKFDETRFTTKTESEE